MQLFQIKSDMGSNRLSEFLKDHFISIGWPEVGDLEGVAREKLRERLAAVCALDGESLSEALEALETFVHGMQDGDYVLLSAGDGVYLGDVGDYFYVECAENGTGHRRGVTWLHHIPAAALPSAVQEFLQDRRAISRFEGTPATAGLERWIAPMAADSTVAGRGSAPSVDEETIAEAIRVLKEALRSDDPERRERAAVALLQYAK